MSFFVFLAAFSEATTGGATVPPDASVLDKRYQFCVLGSGEETIPKDVVKLCKEAAEALQKRETKYVQEESKFLLFNRQCITKLGIVHAKLVKQPLDDFDIALGKFAGSGANDTTSSQNILSCSDDEIEAVKTRLAAWEERHASQGKKQVTEDKKSDHLIMKAAIAEAEALNKKRRESQVHAARARQQLVTGVAGLSKASSDRKFKEPERDSSAKVEVSLAGCSPFNELKEKYAALKMLEGTDRKSAAYKQARSTFEGVNDADLLNNSNDCRALAVAEATRIIGVTKAGKGAGRNNFELLSNVTTSSSDGAIELGGNVTFKRVDRGFTERRDGDWSRRTAKWTVGGSVTAQENNGVADLLGGNRGSGDNFFSLSRLNSDISIKGTAGYSAFPLQTVTQFIGKRDEFLKAAQVVCEKAIADGTTNVITDCRDEAFVTWLYETKDGQLLRKDLAKAYDELIFQSSAKYPLYGFGLSGSVGFNRQEYYDFTNEDKEFEISDADIPLFFSEDSAKLKKVTGTLNGVSYTAGIYSFFHFPLEKMWWTDGATLVFNGAYKNDLPGDLDKNKKQLCLSDGMVTASPLLVDDKCRKVLTSRPEFEESYVGEVEFRLSLDGIMKNLAIAPNFSYEASFSDDDKWRLEAPVFLSGKDGLLRGGFGVAHTVDYAIESDDQAETTVFIFFGRKFSLDGSK